LNGDGNKDLILSDGDLVCHVNPWPWTPGYGRVRLYNGGSGNTLTSAGFLKDINGNNIDIGDCSTPLLTDWNSDGLIDLVLGSYGPKDASGIISNQWRIYINTGTTTSYAFNSYSIISTTQGVPIEAQSMVIRDLDRDGLKDIIYKASSLQPFSWYKNTGSSSSPAYTNSANLVLPTGVTGFIEYFELADVNSDNFLDLVYVDVYYPKVCLGKPFDITPISQIKTESKKADHSWKISVSRQNLIIKSAAVYADGFNVQIFDCRGRSIETCTERGNLASIKLSASGWYAVVITSKGISEKYSVFVN